MIFFIVADDHNRVILEPEDGVPDSDYINASYVDVSNLIQNVGYMLNKVASVALCVARKTETRHTVCTLNTPVKRRETMLKKYFREWDCQNYVWSSRHFKNEVSLDRV